MMKDKTKLRLNTVETRLTDEEFELLRWQAGRCNVSLSQFIRFATVKLMAEIKEAGVSPFDIYS